MRASIKILSVSVSIVFILIGAIFVPPVTSIFLHKLEREKIEERRIVSLPTTNEDTQYWGVVIVIFKYKNPANDLPLPEKQQYNIYNSLMNSKNWKADHIRFLLNENATREKILNALDWLAGNSGPNDVVFFYYNGHGIPVPDNDGDEEDGYDEAICPYDTDVKDGKLVNYISDDEIDKKLDRIESKGMFLAFCSCFSGGLFDDSESLGFRKSNNIKQFNKELTMDIEGDGRVIVTAAMEHGTAIFYKEMFDPFALSLNLALNGKADKNKDGICSAEEIAEYTRTHTLLGHLLYSLGMSSLAALVTVLTGGPAAIPTALLLIILYPVIVELVLYLQSGYFALPFPQIYDGYDGELPLIIL